MKQWIVQENWPVELRKFLIEFGVAPVSGTHRVSPIVVEKVRALSSSFGQAGRASSIESALYLAVGDLERSHEISQADHSAFGSYLHGIMHRREGDFSNADYWFHRAGRLNSLSGIDVDEAEVRQHFGESFSPKGVQSFDPTWLTSLHREVFNLPQETAKVQMVNQLSWQEWRQIANDLIAR